MFCLEKWKIAVAMLAAAVVMMIFTMNTFTFMLLFWSFFAGVSAAVFLLKPGYELPNLLPTKYQTLHSDKSGSNLKTSCSICGLQNCTRDRSDSAIETLQPWIGIDVNERVDEAITEFLDRLLDTYVWNWYRNLSDDETFVHELKVALRHCLAVLYRRVNKIDVAEVIIKKLLHVAMIHLHVCMSAVKAGCKTEEDILMWYGPKIHTALKSRRSELNYIRAMCDSVFPYLCPPSLIESDVGRSFLRELLSSNVILYGIDTMDDPDKINLLLLLFFDKAPPREADQSPSPMVPFLDKFASKDVNSCNSLLYLDLPKIMTPQDNQDMLYQFMSFLKTVGAVHHLQFCLTVDDFNRRCLSQDQDEAQQVKLHSEAKEIYNTYCRPDSPTFIHFSQDIINELRDVANGQPCEVNRLRTSAPLFLAYDHVYNLLEHIYCPLFYQSDTYYKMICGERRPLKRRKPPLKQSSMTNLERSDSTRSSLRKKKETKETPKLNEFSESVDLDQDSNLIDEDEKSAQMLMEDEIQEDFLINRDLSTWRIEIPSIELMRREDLANKSSTSERVYAFYIEIKRVDVQEDDDEPDHWSVLRRYSEFYVLESKLVEFHGSLGIISLPPRKILGRNFDFLDSKRNEFEKFLKALISQPRLRHSELLFDFLCHERGGAGSKFDTKFLPDVKLGRLFRRVPTKLLKEKGQHLSLFLQSFIQSCEPSKPKPGKYEPITDNPEIQMDHKLHNDLYPEGDWMFDSFQSAELSKKTEVSSFFAGVCDYLIFIGVDVFKADDWLHHVMVGVKKLFHATIEPFAYNYLKAKINTYRQEHHVVDIIHTFRDVVFDTDSEPRTEEEKKKRREEAFKEWEEFIPGTFTYLIGSDRHKEGCEKMFGILQKPKLNKQLGYLLLDCLLLELFPELNPPSGDRTR